MSAPNHLLSRKNIGISVDLRIRCFLDGFLRPKIAILAILSAVLSYSAPHAKLGFFYTAGQENTLRNTPPNEKNPPVPTTSPEACFQTFSAAEIRDFCETYEDWIP